VGATGFEPVTSSLQGKNQLILGSIREYQFTESMNLSSYKKISEVIREYPQFLKICGVFVGFCKIGNKN